MADYSIIADVSNYIVGMLREKMCPELIPSPNNIAVTNPAEQDADYILGLYLYDIRSDGEVAMPKTMRVGMTRLQQSPKPYSLYYMVFINGSSQMGLKSSDTHKMIGRAAQIMGDRNGVRPTKLQPWLEIEEPPIIFTANNIDLEEKVRVWSAINKSYQVGLFYKVSPVFISSENIRDVHLVTEAEFNLHLGLPEEG